MAYRNLHQSSSSCPFFWIYTWPYIILTKKKTNFSQNHSTGVLNHFLNKINFDKGAFQSNMEANPLKIYLEAVPSELTIAPGGVIKFPRPILVIQNVGPDLLKILIAQASIFQEGGMHKDVAEFLNKNLIDRFFPNGEILKWDLYDLLAAEHPGVASKVHLFGYKVILNWWFELSIKVEYWLSDESLSVQTPLFQAKFRWNASKPDLEKIDLSILPLTI